MKKIFVFIFGLLLVANIVGGALAWFFIFAPNAKRKEPVVIQVPDAITNKPSENGVRIEGTILLPAALVKILETKPDAILSVGGFINTSNPRAGNVFTNSINIVKPVFPYKYAFGIHPFQIEEVADKESFFLRMVAFVCFDRNGAECIRTFDPKFIGATAFQVKTPGGVKGRISINAPPLVINRFQKPFDKAACDANKGSISGVLTPTKAFHAQFPNQKEFVIFAAPGQEKRLSPPYVRVGQGVGQQVGTLPPLTKEQVAAAGEHGISYVSAILDSSGTAKFTLPIVEKVRDVVQRLYAVACKAGEAPASCLANGFPIESNFDSTKQANHSSILLVAQGFELPSCGLSNHVFYLHAFKQNAPPASQSVVIEADPPEVIEGAHY